MNSRPKNLLAELQALPLVGVLVRTSWPLAARILARPLARSYQRRHAVRKLHIGGAGLAGWLNTDLQPTQWRTMRLDARRRFPFSGGTFAYVFSEHMIEHVPLADARAMLAECHRVLRTDGRVRIATPDLARVVRLHETTDAASRDYLQWSVAHNRLSTDLPAGCVVINSLFHDHGHRFLYDEPTLAAMLKAAGFSDVKRYAPGVSDDPALRDLERHHHVIGHGPNNFETLVLEGRKAGG